MLKLREDANSYPKLLDWLRYFCAFMLYMYGVSKLGHLQFNMSAQLAQRPIGSLNGYQLTWFYYGHSRVYALILGLTQLAGATLLLFRKTTLLAAVIMFPVMANILLINVFILVNDYGPYCAGTAVQLWHSIGAARITGKPETIAAEPCSGSLLYRKRVTNPFSTHFERG
jgi:hypothetical protein